MCCRYSDHKHTHTHTYRKHTHRTEVTNFHNLIWWAHCIVRLQAGAQVHRSGKWFSQTSIPPFHTHLLDAQHPHTPKATQSLWPRPHGSADGAGLVRYAMARPLPPARTWEGKFAFYTSSSHLGELNHCLDATMEVAVENPPTPCMCVCVYPC